MKRFLVKTFAVVLPCTAAGTVLYTSVARSDQPTITDKASGQVGVVTPTGDPHTITVYDDKVVWPIFAFKKDPKSGQLLVDCEESPLKPGDPVKVSIQLLVNPAILMHGAEEQLAARTGKPVPLVSPILRDLYIEEEGEEHLRHFKPFKLTNESRLDEITLTAYMPALEAKEFCSQLRIGKRQVEFRVHAKLYAKREAAAASATARVARISDTEAYTKLVGTGGTSTTTAKDNSVAQTAAAVTRAQKKELTAKIAEEIILKLDITGQPKQLAFVNGQITDFMKTQVFGKERQIDITVAELQKLNPNGFSSDDLLPEAVGRFTAEAKAFLSDETKDACSFAAGGSGWGFSANVSYSKEQVRKTLTDHGWTLSQEGTKFLPKSISVSDVNLQNIQAHVGFSATLTESDYSVVNFEAQVTTRARSAVSPDLDALLVSEHKLREQAAVLEAAVAKELASVAEALGTQVNETNELKHLLELVAAADPKSDWSKDVFHQKREKGRGAGVFERLALIQATGEAVRDGQKKLTALSAQLREVQGEITIIRLRMWSR